MQQELLDTDKDADLRVYAVWFSMYPGDERERWPGEALSDRRVTHYWDEEKVVGRWYMERVTDIHETRAPGSKGVAGAVLWDAYLVYGSESRWDEAPSGLQRWGRTILGTQDTFREAFNKVLGAYP